MKLTLPCLLALVLLPGPFASAQEEPDLVDAFVAATDPKERIELREKILAAAPDPAEVAARLAEGRAYSGDVEKGWLARRNLCSDGVARPYLLFVPEDYDPAKRYRLVVDMHGGVARPATLTHAELEQMKFFWGEHAAEHGYLLALPTGQAGAEWWTDVGAHNVLTLIDRVRREYNVDENLVFATGFSDGGSGSYYLALTWPTMFAGFIPLNGHPSVAGARGLQIHPRNFRNKPMYAVNTENDSLYAAASVKPIMDALTALGAPVVRGSNLFPRNSAGGRRVSILVSQSVLMSDPDAVLMVDFREGDEKAFATLVGRYQDRVLGLAYRYLGDRDGAEDLAQEAFLRVYKARARYEPMAKFSTWLYRIVVNLALNEIRWRKGRKAAALAVSTETSSNLNIDMADEDEPEPHDMLEKAELARHIREIIAKLPESQRIAILLNKYEGLSYQEVAEAMDTSVMAVKSLLTRARVKIKEKLLPYLREESGNAV